MSEKLYTYRKKLIVPGEIYHITQRAPGKELVFPEKADYLNMLHLLKEWVAKFDIDLYSFCLMPNHYHLLLKINKPNLKEAMHSLNTKYAMRFNTKYQRKGHVFCGIYRATICQDDVYFLGASLYIHLNPQKAGIVKKAEYYNWSSVKLYLHPERQSFVNQKYLLEIIDKDIMYASALYQEMLNKNKEIEYKNILEEDKAILNFCKKLYKKMPKLLNNIKNNFIKKEIHIDDLIEEFKKKERKRKPEERQAAKYLIEQLKSRGYNYQQISNILGISRQTIYTIINN